MILLEHDDDKQHASDTISEVADGVADGDASKVGDALEDDAKQTKDDIEDVVLGEDGNNRQNDSK